MTREYFDVIAIIPLEEEMNEFLQVFPIIEDRTTTNHFVAVVDAGNPAIRMIAIKQHDMGKEHTRAAVAAMLGAYDAGLLICLGIAGGLSGDLKLGDVCYTGDLADVTENAKVSDRGARRPAYELSPNFYHTRSDITATLNYVRLRTDYSHLYAEWQAKRKSAAEELVPDPVPSRGGSPERLGAPRSLHGFIACGPVCKSDTFISNLRNINRKMLAIETESGALFAAAQKAGIPALAIRGISDYADASKAALEETTGGAVRTLAAANAATFLKMQFGNPYFEKALKTLRGTGVTAHDGSAVADPLQDALRSTAAMIEGGLRDLSPGYHLMPKGYRLPVPRIKPVNEPESLNAKERAPHEIRDVLAAADSIVITVDRSYPDQGLAYVIANDLLTADLGGRQALPIVLDASLVKPPAGHIDAITQIPLAKLCADEACQPVIIVDNPPLNSRTRIRFLASELKKYPEARIVVVTRDDASLIAESDLAGLIAADPHRLCPVSFTEIAHFVEKNFDIPGEEAGVVALRLRDTFERFNLAAHPSYFAGIPRDTLTALAQANQRAELLQIAVHGFLTFVVAGDTAPVTLTRTTRERFLRKLVFAMQVDKMTFDEQGLVAFTGDFATTQDFDIKPIAFIHGFTDHGILHFHNGKVRFSLAFIEAYLLAAELADNPAAAIAYFDPGADSFDYAAFDLYAEIKPDHAVTARIVSAVGVAIGANALAANATHVLLTNDLNPAWLNNAKGLSALQKSLADAADDVRTGTARNSRKQQLLDLNERIRDAASRQAGKTAADTTDEQPQALNTALTAWRAGVTLIGSAAEHLDAAAKRALAGDLIRLTALVLDGWTRHQAATLDIGKLKAELTSDAAIAELRVANPKFGTADETRRLISSLVDIIETAWLSYPFMRLVSGLCEARRRVLALSIQHAEPAGLIERLIWSTWMADIDASLGKSPLHDAIRDLPLAPFLRLTLAAHCLMRVFWNHWRKTDRLILLDTASAAIKPLSRDVDRDSLKRMINNSDDGGGKEAA